MALIHDENLAVRMQVKKNSVVVMSDFHYTGIPLSTVYPIMGVPFKILDCSTLPFWLAIDPDDHMVTLDVRKMILKKVPNTYFNIWGNNSEKVITLNPHGDWCRSGPSMEQLKNRIREIVASGHCPICGVEYNTMMMGDELISFCGRCQTRPINPDNEGESSNV